MTASRRTHGFLDIRYGQVWEDADVLLDGLDVQPGGTYLSVASAGDNALALLVRNPARVIAVDPSPAQLACLELRVAAFRALSHPQVLELIGSRAVDASTRPLRALPLAALSGYPALLGPPWRRHRRRHRGRRPARTVLRAVQASGAAAGSRTAAIEQLLAPRDRRGREDFYAAPVGHAALAAALQDVLLALPDGAPRPSPRDLSICRGARRGPSSSIGRGTR